jgi:aspartyl-tRNA(Asn)/glutamyl-tRNA(Gln) amidotransferase subunit A
MAGVPIGMKDLFATKGVQTTAASKILEGFVPPYESTVSQKLWDAGAGMLGKLNLDQFAMGSSNETSGFGKVISPWRKGDDTTRWRRVVLRAGLRPPWPRASRRPPPAPTPAARSASLPPLPAFPGSSRPMAAARAGAWWRLPPRSTRPGRWRATCATARSCWKPWPGSIPRIDQPRSAGARLGSGLNADLRGKKVGIPREYRVDGLDADVAKSWDDGIAWLKDAGAEIVDISLPHTKYALPTYYIIAPAEASSNLARYDGVRYGLRDCPKAPTCKRCTPPPAPPVSATRSSAAS